MPSIFIWKANVPNTSKKTIRFYSGSNWVLEDNDYSSKSYIYLEQIVISESDNSVITFHSKDMPQDWVGSELLEVSNVPYELVKTDNYGTLEMIGDWMRFTSKSETSYNETFLKTEFNSIKKWMNNKNKQIYIIDFGFCKTFIINDLHIDLKKTNNMIGTNNFASVNAHDFNELSRRDDLESLGYMLVYFYLGNLAWKDYSNNDMIKIMKNNIMNDESIPKIILKYFEVVKGLGFKERPDYDLLINIFKNELKEL